MKELPVGSLPILAKSNRAKARRREEKICQCARGFLYMHLEYLRMEFPSLGDILYHVVLISAKLILYINHFESMTILIDFFVPSKYVKILYLLLILSLFCNIRNQISFLRAISI